MASSTARALYEQHKPHLEAGLAACASRAYWSPFVESPSGKLHAPGRAEEGLARFSTEPYQNAGGAHMKNLFMHLTNYSINKHSSKFVQNSDATADDTGSKWSLSALRRHLTRCGVDVPRLNALIDELMAVCAQPIPDTRAQRLAAAEGLSGRVERAGT